MKIKLLWLFLLSCSTVTNSSELLLTHRSYFCPWHPHLCHQEYIDTYIMEKINLIIEEINLLTTLTTPIAMLHTANQNLVSALPKVSKKISKLEKKYKQKKSRRTQPPFNKVTQKKNNFMRQGKFKSRCR